MGLNAVIPKVAQATGKSQNDVKKALTEGEKIISGGATNMGEIKKIMTKQGITPEFIDSLINNSEKGKSYYSKLGLSDKVVKDGLKTLKNLQSEPVSGGSGRADPNHNKNGSSAFDKSKYRKV